MLEHSENRLKATIKGQLTFNDNTAFHEISSKIEDQKIKQLDLDLKDLDYIKYSGIGILLVLKERCDEHKVHLTLQHPQGQVAQLLRVTAIDNLIPITA